MLQLKIEQLHCNSCIVIIALQPVAPTSLDLPSLFLILGHYMLVYKVGSYSCAGFNSHPTKDILQSLLSVSTNYFTSIYRICFNSFTRCLKSMLPVVLDLAATPLTEIM